MSGFPENIVEHSQNSNLLQDLLHIREILGDYGFGNQTTPPKAVPVEESCVKESRDSISSSDESSSDDEESEAEIEASLVLAPEGNATPSISLL